MNKVFSTETLLTITRNTTAIRPDLLPVNINNGSIDNKIIFDFGILVLYVHTKRNSIAKDKPNSLGLIRIPLNLEATRLKENHGKKRLI